MARGSGKQRDLIVMARKGRGFVFSIDALLAAITMGIFLTALLHMSSQTGERNAANMLLRKQAGDALAVLDKTGSLEGKNLSTMNETLEWLMPYPARWNLELYYYNYSGSGGFVLAEQVNLTKNSSRLREVQTSERSFAVFANGSLQQYGWARMKLWLER